MPKPLVSFFDSLGGKINDVRVVLGTTKLFGGSAEITLPHIYPNWYTVSITTDSSSADYMYSVEFLTEKKFIINSSDSDDTKEVRWVAIGY